MSQSHHPMVGHVKSNHCKSTLYKAISTLDEILGNFDSFFYTHAFL